MSRERQEIGHADDHDSVLLDQQTVLTFSLRRRAVFDSFVTLLPIHSKLEDRDMKQIAFTEDVVRPMPAVKH